LNAAVESIYSLLQKYTVDLGTTINANGGDVYAKRAEFIELGDQTGYLHKRP